tara:strand:- start:27061 stop:27240 length:180 start_codon:yes stop_codon:yes gene_type:complete
VWNHIDIDPVFIEEEKRKRHVDDRPQIQLPLPQYRPPQENTPPQEDESEKRGVVIIELI